MTRFTVGLAREAGRAVVRVDGELDIATAPELAAVLDEAAAAGDLLVVDLTGTTFLDSSGLRTMVGKAREVDRFVLVCPADNTAVRRVVTFAGFDLAVPVVETIDQVDPPG